MATKKKKSDTLKKARGPTWVNYFSRLTKTKREKEIQEQRKRKQKKYEGE